LDNLHYEGLLDFSTTVLAGHSMGAHVAGFTGKNVRRGRINTIFGLDTSNSFDVNDPTTRLDSSDAEYVERKMSLNGCENFNVIIQFQ